MSKCFAIGCKKQVMSSMFGCRPHWYQVPEEIRRAIWREYRAGRVLGQSYCDAAIAAIRAVAEAEGKQWTGDEPEFRLYDRLRERHERRSGNSDRAA